MQSLGAVDWHLWLEVGHYVAAPLLYWAGRRLVTALDEKVAAATIAEADRVQKQLTNFITDQFKRHELCDDKIVLRMTAIEHRLNHIEARLIAKAAKVPYAQ